ncbi:hypothetical protein ONE63_006264 [Megalurothrips usitatus]|uniref:Uncharacterized protein n=1 Tax=Megalurothrips usitatus TaxID=439358 RepID=A0AAV7XWV6_9NEOP|nr:hypothetical protein ONE63_006264 [Megalurothrips usitatus]
MVSSKGDCLVRDVKLQNGNIGPILVNFEHGRLKKKAVSGLKCKVFSANDSSKICTVGAVVEGGDVVYQGDVERDEGDICHNFLAIRNKKTNKIRIYEASNVTLSPSVASDCGINLDMPDYSEAVYNLNQTFGSKKVKRVADQRKRMQINVDNVKTNLTSAISNIEVKNDITLDVEDDSLASMLPPCNRSATNPADVYPISGILSDEELTHLEEFYTRSIADGTFEKLHKKNHFFNKMEKFISPEDPRNAALLLYADCLLAYCNLQMKEVKKTNKGPCPYSTLIHEKILREFTTRAGTEQKCVLLTHI